MIMTVIMVWYSVSFYSLLYPNSEFSWTQIEKVIANGYWMLFGELNLDGDTCKNRIISMIIKLHKQIQTAHILSLCYYNKTCLVYS